MRLTSQPAGKDFFGETQTLYLSCLFAFDQISLRAKRGLNKGRANNDLLASEKIELQKQKWTSTDTVIKLIEATGIKGVEPHHFTTDRAVWSDTMASSTTLPSPRVIAPSWTASRMSSIEAFVPSTGTITLQHDIKTRVASKLRADPMKASRTGITACRRISGQIFAWSIAKLSLRPYSWRTSKIRCFERWSRKVNI